jgi:hypothetical protein
MIAKVYYRLVDIASFLPDSWLKWIGKQKRLCFTFDYDQRKIRRGYDHSDCWTFWIDASYHKYVRRDMRKNS